MKANLEIPFHLERRTRILKEHPEVRKLYGRNRWSALAIVLIVLAQTAIAAWIAKAQLNGWWIAFAAVTIGAILNHAAFVMIHECAHALVFRSKGLNSAFMLLSNLPFVVPSAASFQKYHLIHHRELGEVEWDADVPPAWETRLIGNSAPRKALWLLFFPLFYSLRTRALPSIPFFDRWTAANILLQAAYSAALWFFFGPIAVLYLFAAAMLSIGLHPLGGRWFQEHFVFEPGQESNSYYGIGNLVSFNVGHHVEHHDLPGIPWNRLPKLRELAPEYYLSLRPVKSWTGAVLQFIFDPGMSLSSRVIRNRVEVAHG